MLIVDRVIERRPPQRIPCIQIRTGVDMLLYRGKVTVASILP